MNRNEFNRFVAGIDLPGPADLEGLRELTALISLVPFRSSGITQGAQDEFRYQV